MIPRIRPRVTPYFKEKGFRRKGGFYYKIIDNIAFCILIEHPSSIVYSHFSILPLYIPSDNAYLNYGNRLNNMYMGRLPQLNNESSYEDIDEWFCVLCQILEEDIFPYFDSISSIEKLLSFVEQDFDSVRKYLFSSDEWLLKLQMYSYLYLHQADKAKFAIDQYQKALQNDRSLTEACRKMHIAEAEELESTVLCMSALEQNEYFEQVITATKNKMFGI